MLLYVCTDPVRHCTWLQCHSRLQSRLADVRRRLLRLRGGIGQIFIYLFIGERTVDNVNKAVTLQLDNKAQAWH